MIIYIDSLFLTNFFMDSVLLFITGLSLKKYNNNLRILLGSVFLSIYGTLIFFADLNFIVSAILNILSVVAGITISFGREKIVRYSAVFLIISSLCGGIVLALTSFSDFGTVMSAAVSNGTFYMNISPYILILGSVILYFSAEFFKRLHIKNFSRERLMMDIYFTYGNKEYKVKSLIDTGCSLTEPLSGEPMLIIDKDVVSFSDGPEIVINTVSGMSRMNLIFPDKIWTYSDEIALNPKTPVALARYKINADGIYNGILNPDAIINDRKDREICQGLKV